MQRFECEAAKVCEALSKLEREGDETILNSFPLLHWELRRPRLSDGCQEYAFSAYLYHPAVILGELNNGGDNSGKNMDKITNHFDEEEGEIEIAPKSLEDDSVLYDTEGCVGRPKRDHFFRVNFSIVYSVTYSVPVLYFHAQDMNGTQLSRSKVLDWLAPFPDDNEGNIQGTVDEEASWEFVSQEQHPVTGLPSYFLHPCRTAERMTLLRMNGPAMKKESTNSRENEPLELWSWMSMILPAVQFAVPSKLFQAVVDETTRRGDS